MNILEFQDVHRGYKRGTDVLKGVSFAVPPGQVVGLLGKNGAGKTTLLRIAMGLLQVGRGTARVLLASVIALYRLQYVLSWNSW